MSDSELLAAFEREYKIERVSQRDLMLQLGAVLWFLAAGTALLAGQLDSAPESVTDTYVRIFIAICSAAIAVSYMTVIRRLDDQRTLHVITALSVVAIVFQYILSSYGPGAMGVFVVATIGITVFAGQFLGRGSLIMLLVLIGVFSGLAAENYYGSPQAPSIVSQTVLLQAVLWMVGFSVRAHTLDRARALAEAERVAFDDPLTGLPNARMLRRNMEVLLDSRNQRINRRTGLIVLDLDGFRAANMLHGRRGGDQVLVAVASAAQGAVDPEQLVARTGSDEFTVMVPDTTRADLESLGDTLQETIREAMNRKSDIGDGIDASVGVAISGEDGDSFDALMSSADRSMYKMKEAHASGASMRRVPTPGVSNSNAGWKSDPSPASNRSSRWSWLRWSNRSDQAKFVSMSWLTPAIAVPVALAMPDAVAHNDTAVAVLVVFALIMAAARYTWEPATHLDSQMVEVLIGSIALGVAIYFTGGSASAVTPVELLILIYIGWFVPLKWVLPATAMSVTIGLSALLIDSSSELLLLDAVTIFGGMAISVALLVVLYYNHYYLERARALTDELAFLDPRAGTNNRRAFDERMRVELEALSYGDRDALAVIAIDLGGLKGVVAESGRAVGDRLLTVVASALDNASREEDCVARLGGDLFAIVAPGVDAESALILARRLVDSVNQALVDTDLPSPERVRPSAGFALYGMHGHTTDELLSAAEVALTAAKTSGRDPNRVSSFVVAL